jgi:hypothetical protein
MNILFRYMLREYVKIFGMCFAGLMTIYLVIDFFEKVRRFLRYDAHALDVLAYFVLKMPAISYQIAPLAVLMATLLTIGLLSRSHEITAMRSCGISLYWITSPFLFLGTVLAMVLFLFSSTVIPLALAKAEQIKTTPDRKTRVAGLGESGTALGQPGRPNIDEHRHHRPRRSRVAKNPPLSLEPHVRAGADCGGTARGVFAAGLGPGRRHPALVPAGWDGLGEQFSDGTPAARANSRRLHDLAGVGFGNDDAAGDSCLCRSAASGRHDPPAPAD